MDVNWGTKVITIYKTDLQLVSGTLYELDTNWLRLQLKAAEDDIYGMASLRTHRHNTEVTVAGVTYARTIEIINGYKIEFENDAYSVILSGSNNNMFSIQGGILVQNQVQVIPNNSAGLQTVISGSGVTPQDKQDIISGVWDEQISAHNIVGTFGHYIQKKVLSVAKFLGLK